LIQLFQTASVVDVPPPYSATLCAESRSVDKFHHHAHTPNINKPYIASSSTLGWAQTQKDIGGQANVALRQHEEGETAKRKT
jgi:hypothetical protein